MEKGKEKVRRSDEVHNELKINDVKDEEKDGRKEEDGEKEDEKIQFQASVEQISLG